MEKEKLEQLKKLLQEFADSDTFGLGEMEYLEQVNEVIELVDGAIINNEQ